MSNLLYEAYNKISVMSEERSFPSYVRIGARAPLARRAEWNSDEEIETKRRLGGYLLEIPLSHKKVRSYFL